jgi:hypothetical protein
VALIIASAAAFLVWNGIFGLHVSRGEKQYLLEEARHAAGRRVTMPSAPAIMTDTVRDGARQASRWALVVFIASLGASYAGARLTRREA